MKFFAVILLSLLLILAFYGLLIRPWFLGWGATAAEAIQSLPGDELVPAPRMPSTRAVTIHAPEGDSIPLAPNGVGWTVMALEPGKVMVLLESVAQGR